MDSSFGLLRCYFFITNLIKNCLLYKNNVGSVFVNPSKGKKFGDFIEVEIYVKYNNILYD